MGNMESIIIIHYTIKDTTNRLQIHAINSENYILVCKDNNELKEMYNILRPGHKIKFKHDHNNIITGGISILSKRNETRTNKN